MTGSELLANLPSLLVATIVLVAGLGTIALSALQLKDRALLYLGLFATLYGARLLVINEIFRLAFQIPENVALWCSAVVTYTILIPGALFARALLGSGWPDTVSLPR